MVAGVLWEHHTIQCILGKISSFIPYFIDSKICDAYISGCNLFCVYETHYTFIV